MVKQGKDTWGHADQQEIADGQQSNRAAGFFWGFLSFADILDRLLMVGFALQM